MLQLWFPDVFPDVGSELFSGKQCRRKGKPKGRHGIDIQVYADKQWERTKADRGDATKRKTVSKRTSASQTLALTSPEICFKTRNTAEATLEVWNDY